MLHGNWMPGDPVIIPIPQTYEGLLERVNNPESLGVQCSQWYMCYKDYDELGKNTVNNTNKGSTKI